MERAGLWTRGKTKGTKDKVGESKVRRRMLDILYFQRNQQDVVTCDSDVSYFSKTSTKLSL